MKLLSFSRLKYLLPALSIALLCGCAKETAPIKTNFSFKANGILYEWNSGLNSSSDNQAGGAEIYRAPASNNYVLFAKENDESDFYQNHQFLQAAIITEGSLTETTYAYGSRNESPAYNAFHHKELNSEGQVTYKFYDNTAAESNSEIVITKIKDGYASGTFYLKLHSGMLITEGKFSNVKITN